MNFAIVVAMDKNRGIGKNGKLPWHISGELQHFAQLTRATRDPEGKNAVIMGRKSWESLPLKYRPLPGRLNMVMTRQLDYELPPEAFRVNSLEESLTIAQQQDVERVFVIGGAGVFKSALGDPRCTTLYMTEIQSSFDCDTFFPSIDEKQFKVAEVSDLHQAKGHYFRFVEYRRQAVP